MTAPTDSPPFNTLAVAGIATDDGQVKRPVGGKKEQIRRLHKLARRKATSTVVAAHLWQGNFATGDPLIWAYGRTMDCAAVAEQDPGDRKIRRHYCKNRWCPTCQAIRTAKQIKQYTPILDSWEDELWFVTLTARNVTAAELETRLDEFTATFNRCRDSLRKQHGIRLEAVRVLEITHNAAKYTFHPHYHVAVRGMIAALLLRDYWLKKWGKESDPRAQDIRPYTGDPAEVFKYTTKLLSDKEPVDAKALSVIFGALRNRNAVQSFGFKAKPVQDAVEEEIDDMRTTALTEANSRVGERVTWTWVPGATDYVDLLTGDCLTGYTPSSVMQQVLDSFATAEQVTEVEEQIARARQDRDGDRRRQSRLDFLPPQSS